jgi:hypothetical protein
MKYCKHGLLLITTMITLMSKANDIQVSNVALHLDDRSPRRQTMFIATTIATDPVQRLNAVAASPILGIPLVPHVAEPFRAQTNT